MKTFMDICSVEQYRDVLILDMTGVCYTHE